MKDLLMQPSKSLITRMAGTSSVTKAYVALLLTMVVWGLVPAFLKQLLAVLSPTELSFIRFFFAGAVMLAWILPGHYKEVLGIFRDDWRLMLLCTLCGPLVAMVCFNFGLSKLTVGTAAVFTAIEPVCTYLFAVLLGQERWKAGRMLSILVALTGIVLVIFSRESFGVGYWLSLVLVTLSPIIWAANNIITKELAKRHAAMVMVAVSFFLSSLLLLPTLPADLPAKLASMPPALWLVLGYTVLCNIFGFTFWYWSLKHLPSSTVALSMYLLPVLSVAAGMLLLGESLSLLKGIGILTVMLGLYLTNVRFR